MNCGGTHMVTSRKHHLLITGTGRAGTTFLVKLLTHLGFDTGFTSDYMPQKEYKRSGPVYENTRGGLEHHGLGGNLPYIIKNPKLMWQLPELLKNNSVVIDHVIIPIRNIQAASESRRVNVRNVSDIVDPRLIPGGLEGVTDPQKQEEFFLEKFYEFFHFISTYNIPVTLLQYPRLVSDRDYLYHKLSRVFKGLNKDDFDRSFKETVEPSLVNKYNPNDDYLADIYDDSYNNVLTEGGSSNYQENIEMKEMRERLIEAENTLEDIIEFRKPKEVYAELFYKVDNHYTQDNSIGKYVSVMKNSITFDFIEPKNVEGLRFDPCEEETVVCINSVVVKANGKKFNINAEYSNCRYKNDENGYIFYFLNSDPQIHIPYTGIVESVTIYLSYLAIGKSESYALSLPFIENDLNMIKEKDNQLNAVYSQLSDTKNHLDKLSNSIVDIVKDKDIQLAQINEKLIRKQEELQSKKQELVNREYEISALRQLIEEKNEEMLFLKNRINTVELEIREFLKLLNQRESNKLKKGIFRLMKNISKFLINPIKRVKLLYNRRVLRKSGIFDAHYYLYQNRDLIPANINLLEHFLEYGWKEGRSPNPEYNMNELLEQNPTFLYGNKNPILEIIKNKKS